MNQSQKLDALISKIIKEELGKSQKGVLDVTIPSKKSGMEEDKEYVTQDGTANTATGFQRTSIAKEKPGATIKYRKAGSSQGALGENEEEMQEFDIEQKPKASEIAGQLAEIMEKLKSMAEGDDPKKGKHAAKVMKYMESAKAALEALTAHETMLEEKDEAAQTKAAEKHRKNIERIFKGIVKDENIVSRLVSKISVEDLVTLKKRLSSKGSELDEEKLARVMLNKSLKEGWVIENSSGSKFKEDLSKLSTGVKNFGESLKKAGFNVAKGRK